MGMAGKNTATATLEPPSKPPTPTESFLALRCRSCIGLIGRRERDSPLSQRRFATPKPSQHSPRRLCRLLQLLPCQRDIFSTKQDGPSPRHLVQQRCFRLQVQSRSSSVGQSLPVHSRQGSL